MVTIGDVERRQSFDRARESRNRLHVVNDPELVAHAVVRGHIDGGAAGGGALEQGVERGGGRIGEHDRAGLRVHRLDLAHAVVFLRRRRMLVPADAVFGVGGKRSDRRQAGLDLLFTLVLPGQPVGVVEGPFVAPEYAGHNHVLQILGGLRVHCAVIGIDRGIEVDLGLGDMEKAPWPGLGAHARFRARQHVIGRRENFRGAAGRRPQRAEGLYQGHLDLLRSEGGPLFEQRTDLAQDLVDDVPRGRFQPLGPARPQIEGPWLIATHDAGRSSPCAHKRYGETCGAGKIAAGGNRQHDRHSG